MSIIDINTVNPYIRVAIRSVLQKGTVIKQRIIFDYELIYIEDGGMTFTYNKFTYQCKKGQFILIRPGISHSLDCTKQELSQPHIHFDIAYTFDSKKTPVSFKDFPQLTLTERALVQKDLFCDFPQSPFVTFSDPEYALALFYKVIDYNGSNQKLTAKGILTALLAQLIHDNFPSLSWNETENSCDIAQQLKDFIDAGCGVRINLDALEKQFSYNKFHLERAFKKKYHVSLIAYAHGKRMELAKIMLESKTVSEVAEEVGFSSIYAFSRAFKNHFGISPSAYRKTMI